MTLEEKTSLLSGSAFWFSKDIKRLELEKFMLSDGPHGLRKQEAENADHMGTGSSNHATCFPAGGTIAQAWDASLVKELAAGVAHECILEGVSVLLGPAINIKRHPHGGRNFEYFSEDPLLAGRLAVAFINGVQELGIGTSLKHFAANNQEYNRMRVDTCVDERTLREIYLPAFELAVREAQPWTIMAAYNRLNGTYCTDSRWLLTTVLREQWGFQGIVVSDWMAVNDRVAAVEAGMDLEMPASGGVNDRIVQGAVESGNLSVGALDAVVRRVVALMLTVSTRRLESQKVPPSMGHAARLVANHALAGRLATESAVLLKNEVGLLPLKLGGEEAPRRLAVIGGFATAPRYQGAGSSRINPHALDIPLEALRSRVAAKGSSAGMEVVHASGYDATRCIDDAAAIAEAVHVAKEIDGAVICIVGLPPSCETEMCDRDHMSLPAQMDALVYALAEVAPERLVVVMLCGCAVAMPWLDKVSAVLHMGLGGQAMGGAMASLLYGDVSPCGKLAETWPLQPEDCASHPHFASHPRQVVYREGLNVGYRHFCTHQTPVCFPFGHGRTYTTFEYSKLRLSAKSMQSAQTLTVGVEVTNTGRATAKEIVQVYVRDVDASVHRPDRELAAFGRTADLPPGSSEVLTLELRPRAFAFWDSVRGDWYVEPGDFEILVAASAEDVRLRDTITIGADKGGNRGAAPPTVERGGPRGYVSLSDDDLLALGLTVPPADARMPYDENSTIDELVEVNCLVSGAYRALIGLVKVLIRHTNFMGDGMGDEEVMLRIVERGTGCQNLRSFQLMSDGGLKAHVVEAMLLIANGKVCEGLGRLFGGAGGDEGGATSRAASGGKEGGK